MLSTSHTKFSLVYVASGICPLLSHCLKFVIFDVTDNKLTPQDEYFHSAPLSISGECTHYCVYNIIYKYFIYL